MSDPPTTSSEPPQHHHHHHPHHQQQLIHLPLIHGGSSTAAAGRINTAAATSSSTVIVREYRKGNWTLQETMILITAKKLDDERRNKANLAPPPDPTARKGGELRWKWVENYCWSHGCHRSQNQCNDKWDNLLRDYKKVREYESRACDQSQILPSYWKMEKHERKDKNLPSNMAFEVYQALNDVVQRKLRVAVAGGSTTTTTTGVVAVVAANPPPPSAVAALPAAAPTTATNSPAVSESSSGTESSEKKDNMESKRRKMGDIGRSIERSASALAQTLRRCEEQREIRHQQLMEVRQRRLQIEEARNHLQRQGIADLVAAVANLSGINNRTTTTTRSEGYGCLYSGEELRMLKEQNEAMQAELMNVKTELSQLRDQMPSLMQTMMHNMIHNIQPPPPPTSLSQQPSHPHSSMDPSGSGGDA